jgi:hypothetical protein
MDADVYPKDRPELSIVSDGAIGWCLEPHDLAVSKLIAGRDKDFDFVGVMVAAKIVSIAVIQERIKETAADPFLLQRASGGVERLSQAGP